MKSLPLEKLQEDVIFPAGGTIELEREDYVRYAFPTCESAKGAEREIAKIGFIVSCVHHGAKVTLVVDRM